MSWFNTRWVVGPAVVALAACSADEPPATGVAPPVIGDLGGTATPAQAATASPGAARPGAARPGAAAPAPTGAPAIDEARVAPASVLDDFEPKIYCNSINLSQCSVYGSKYNRLDSVRGFCTQLGGEVTSSCSSENVVARCITDADVLVHYYSVGEKPMTKEEAEAKCAAPGRKARIIR